MGRTTSDTRLSSSITILAASGGFTLPSVGCGVTVVSTCSPLCSGCEVDATVELSSVEKVVAGSVSSLVEDSDEDSDDELFAKSVVGTVLEPSSEVMFVGSITVTGVTVTVGATSHWAVGVIGIVLSVSSPTLLSIKGASTSGDTDGTSTGVIAAGVAVLQHIVTSGVMELDGDFASLIIWPSIVGPDSCCVLVDCDWSLLSPLLTPADPIDCTTEVLFEGWKLCCCEDRTDVALPFTSDFLLSDLFNPAERVTNEKREARKQDKSNTYLYFQCLSWMSNAHHRNRLPRWTKSLLPLLAAEGLVETVLYFVR